MREIRFRVWFPGPNVMGKVTNLKGSNVGYEFDGIVAECFIDGKQVFYEAYKNFVLMQSTGLKDKNGVEIYEGDVVMWKDGSDDPEHWRYAEVFYQPKSLCYHFQIVKCGHLEIGYVFKNNFGGYRELKVIGNIYSNPELLKK